MKIALFIIGGLVIFLLIVWLVKVLWNWLVPSAFKGPTIRFSHALAMVILCRLLFGFGFFRGYPGYYMRHRLEHSCGHITRRNHTWFDNNNAKDSENKQNENDSIK